jgi:hypothetical protein
MLYLRLNFSLNFKFWWLIFFAGNLKIQILTEKITRLWPIISLVWLLGDFYYLNDQLAGFLITHTHVLSDKIIIRGGHGGNWYILGWNGFANVQP